MTNQGKRAAVKECEMETPKTDFSRSILAQAEAEAKKLNHPLITMDHVYTVILKSDEVIEIIRRFGGNDEDQVDAIRDILESEDYLRACVDYIEMNELAGTRFADGFTLPAHKKIAEMVEIAEVRANVGERGATEVDFMAGIVQIGGSYAHRQLLPYIDGASLRRYLGVPLED
jgi:hypothetical protein